MAQIEYHSVTTLIQDIDRFAQSVPGMTEKILVAQADIVEPALKRYLVSSGLVKTGRLQDSIGRSVRQRGRKIILGPTGVHHTYVSKKGRAGALRAGHLGYILEYGAPLRNIRGSAWLSKAVDQSQAAAHNAAKDIHDQYLRKHNF